MDIKLNIIAIKWPGAVFNSLEAIESYAPHCDAIEAAIAAYEADLCEEDLWEALKAQGFENYEVQWCIDNPGRRPRIGYM
jgi:hypothetical protein